MLGMFAILPHHRRSLIFVLCLSVYQSAGPSIGPFVCLSTCHRISVCLFKGLHRCTLLYRIRGRGEGCPLGLYGGRNGDRNGGRGYMGAGGVGAYGSGRRTGEGGIWQPERYAVGIFVFPILPLSA
ncbi:hypothetical protein HOY80DRAFT_948062 [Tuber brumale]|nr:hypothetical protein HOY80DRAFT_948062 [Tuber brumale]